MNTLDIPTQVRAEIESLGDVSSFADYPHKTLARFYPYERALRWILAHGENEISAYHDGVMRLIQCRDIGSTAVLFLLVRYNQQPWLWERMTFHALAEVQKYGFLNGIRTLPCDRTLVA